MFFSILDTVKPFEIQFGRRLTTQYVPFERKLCHEFEILMVIKSSRIVLHSIQRAAHYALSSDKVQTKAICTHESRNQLDPVREKKVKVASGVSWRHSMSIVFFPVV